ncbi:sugar phosphate isomerase/epimerase family protein [Nakamurella antarctica]|uniref:sugar phosphate isomerase/epimerase family protein n=1 Tax=Nakamurella antarctica TaxID=1902245 RepID=UPI0019D2779E|nr:TIM barrel protein [Nakamurella antarctica]
MSAPSVQLFSVRSAIDDDLQGTVARLADIGFRHVEPYGFQHRVPEYRQAFADCGISAPTGHAALVAASEPERIFEAALELGISTVIEPHVPASLWKSLEDVKVTADRLNSLSAKATEHGLNVGYHNHQWEFANQIEGRPAYEVFVQHLAPEVLLEVDLFWLTVGGGSGMDILRSLGSQVTALHVKDGNVTGDIRDVLPRSEQQSLDPARFQAALERQTPAGQGEVALPDLLAAAPRALRVIEFDAFAGDVFDGIAQSFVWLSDNDTEVSA